VLVPSVVRSVLQKLSSRFYVAGLEFLTIYEGREQKPAALLSQQVIRLADAGPVKP
jgi:hypothetical protein